MPVNETLSLRDALDEDGLELDAVIVNALYPARFDDAEAGELAAALTATRSPAGAQRAAGRAVRARARPAPSASSARG